MIPRPWSCTLNADKPNTVLHFDWFFVGKSNYEVEWCLFISCGFSGLLDIITGCTPNKEDLLSGLLSWHSWFTLPKVWVSDCGTHMKNWLIDSLRMKLKADHKFVLPYMHWLNSVGERKHKDALQIFRVLCIEFKMDIKEWPQLVPLVKYCLNHTPLQSLGGLTPAEIFTKNKSATNLFNVFDTELEVDEVLINDVMKKENIVKHFVDLQHTLKGMYSGVYKARDKQRAINRKNHKGIQCNFDIGDYVLWSRVDKVKGKSKISCFWIGPYKILKCNNNDLFLVQNLITNDEFEAHGSRLKYYCDSDLNVTTELKEFIMSQDILLDVESILDHKWNVDLDQYEFLIKWRGFQDVENSWESFDSLYSDIRVILTKYISDSSDPKLKLSLERQ